MTDRIAIDFEAFNIENPRVYELFDRFTRELIRAGREHGSAGLIAERIRWETTIDFDRSKQPPLKLNNNYWALYARLWESNNPQYKGFFHKRERRSVTVSSTRYVGTELRA